MRRSVLEKWKREAMSLIKLKQTDKDIISFKE